MSKHKRRPLRIIDRIAKPLPPTPEQDGLQAFFRADFNAAIACWSAVTPRSEPLKAALAEAYMRRALLSPDPARQTVDLRHAEQVLPGEPRIQYLLGLAAQHKGDLAGAIARYRAVLQVDPSWPGAGLLLALATLRQHPSADLAALPGATPAVHAALAAVQTLLQGGRPAVAGDGSLDRFWYGLGLINAGDGSALEALQDTRALPAARATAIRRYYRGVAAAQRGDLDEALKAWQHVLSGHTVQPWLSANLLAVLLRDDGAHFDPQSLRANDPFTTHLHAQAAAHASLAALLARTYDRTAHRAAASGDWQTAATHWEQARTLISDTTGLGSPRRIWHNLALAYEALERWPEAATAWRAMLRTRPRGVGSAASAAEGDYSAEQWAWVRTRVLECYKRAGTPGEAVTLFRQALKKDPQDLETRLQLAEALLANEQERAALGELERLLEIDPRHVEALLMLTAIHAERHEFHQALQMMRRAHQEMPEREDVTRALVGLLSNVGSEHQQMGLYGAAIASFEEAWKLAPADWHFPIYLARVSIDQRKVAQAHPLLRRAEELGAGHAAAYALVIEGWAMAGEITEARAVLERVEAAAALPPEFYIQAGTTLLTHVGPAGLLDLPKKEKAKAAVLSDLAVEIIEHGAARHPQHAPYFQQAASALLLSRSQVAQRMAEEAVRLDPASADALLLLGTLQGLNQQVKEAQQTLRAAARLARKAGNHELARNADELVRAVNNPQVLRAQMEMALALRHLGLDDVDDLDLDDDGFFP